jgi:FkbM family methyltransferase
MKLLNYLYRYTSGLGFFAGLSAFGATYLRRGPMKIVPRDGGIIWLRDNSSDRCVFRQVFLDRVYDTHGWQQQHNRLHQRYSDIKKRGHIPVIIDAGANIGLVSIWFSEQFPASKIFAIEPDQGNLSVLARNAEKRHQIVPLAGAIWDRSEQLCIVDALAASDAFRVIEGEGNIRAYSIPEVAAMEPDGEIFIVKIDIEGGESALFRSNIAWITEPGLIIVEPHDWLYPGEGITQSFRRAIADLRIDLMMRGENLFCFSCIG